MSFWMAGEWTYPQLKGGMNEHIQWIKAGHGHVRSEGRAMGMRVRRGGCEGACPLEVAANCSCDGTT